MSDDRTTGKVAPRASETPTDKVKGAGVLSLMKWAKGNPWVLAVLALGGGTGGQEVLAQLGQQVQWWWIAVAVAAFGLMNYLTDFAKRFDRMRDDIGQIKTALQRGADRFDRIEDRVESLADWRAQVVAAQTAAAISGRKKARSEGKLKPSDA